jgi:hypothetical protein
MDYVSVLKLEDDPPVPRILWRVQHSASFARYSNQKGFEAEPDSFTPLDYEKLFTPEGAREFLDLNDQFTGPTPFILLYDDLCTAHTDLQTRHRSSQSLIEKLGEAEVAARYHRQRGDPHVFIAKIDTSEFEPFDVCLSSKIPEELIRYLHPRPETCTNLFCLQESGKLFSEKAGVQERAEWLGFLRIPARFVDALLDAYG